MRVSEEAVVANAMETVRQHVEQEAPHELADVEAHDLALVTTALPIVLPAETDMGLIKIEQAAVSDRDAMRVAREISQDLLGTGEGPFGIDDPFGRSQWCEVGSELVRSEEHTSELQSRENLVCRLLLEKKKKRRCRQYRRSRRHSGGR